MTSATVQIVVEWQPGTFLENLAPQPDGSWLVTIPSHQRIDRVAPTGEVSVAAELDALPTGIATDDQGVTHVVAGHLGRHDWTLRRLTDGSSDTVCELPELSFGNGMTRDRDTLLVADSAEALLLAIDLDTATSRIWRRHELLAGFTDTVRGPGANGITAIPRAVYVTNTGQALLLRFPVDDTVGMAGPDPEVVAADLEADDFTVADDGTIYLATHFHHTVLALHPDRTREVIAGPEHGIAGSTSVAIDPADPTTLLVTTTGGMRGIAHHDGRPARLLRLHLDQQTPRPTATVG